MGTVSMARRREPRQSKAWGVRRRLATARSLNSFKARGMKAMVRISIATAATNSKLTC